METNHFWNKVAVKYAARPVPDEAIYQKKLTLSQEVFNNEMNVLEIGCGTGSTAIINAPFVNQYKATDISEKMIEIARNKLQKLDIDNLQFNVETIEQSLQREAKYDVIMAHSLLHLLEHPEKTLASVYASLKPGGYVISSTVCMGDHLAWFKLVAPIGRLFGLMPLLNIFKKQTLTEWHKYSGFEVLTNWTPEESKHTAFIIARKSD